jgi:hypothetical protein
VNGTEIKVKEPPHIILDYMEDPTKPWKLFERTDSPNFIAICEKEGGAEGNRRFRAAMHIA